MLHVITNSNTLSHTMNIITANITAGDGNVMLQIAGLGGCAVGILFLCWAGVVVSGVFKQRDEDERAGIRADACEDHKCECGACEKQDSSGDIFDGVPSQNIQIKPNTETK